MKKKSFLLAMVVVGLTFLSPSLHHNLQAESSSKEANPKELPLPQWVKIKLGDLDAARRTDQRLKQSAIAISVLQNIERNNQVKKITELDLSGADITDAQLIQVAKMDNLTSLDLSRTNITDAQLSQLSGLKKLKKLNLHLTGINGKGFVYLKGLENLEELKLGSSYYNFPAPPNSGIKMAELKQLQYLKRLSLDILNPTYMGMSQLSEMTHLVELTIDLSNSHCRQLRGFQFLKGLVHLEKLSFRSRQFSLEKNGITHLKKLTKLKELNLVGFEITGQDISQLKDLENLERLDVLYNNSKSKGLAYLKGLPHLKELNLHFRSSLSYGMHPEELHSLKELPKLKTLKLFLGEINDEWVKNLAGLQNLKKLEMSYDSSQEGLAGAGGAGFSHLKELTSLEELSIGGAGISELNMKYLGNFSNLRSLNLSSSICSAKGLEFLVKLKKLESLVLPAIYDTPLSKEEEEISKEEEENLDYKKTHQRTDHLFRGEGRLGGIENNFEPYICYQHSDFISSDEGLSHLEGLTHLKHLEIRAIKMNGSGLKSLAKMKNLQTLSFQLWKFQKTNTDFESKTLNHLSDLKNMKHLRLSGVTISGQKNSFCQSMKNLKILVLGNVTYKEDGFQCLKPLSNLKLLSINQERVTGDGLASFPPLPHLEVLSLHYVEMTDKDCKFLKGLPKIRSLSITLHPKDSKGSMTGAGLQNLKGSPELHTLLLYNVEAHSQLTPAGLSVGVSKLTSLQFLSIMGMPDGDLLLPHLERLKNLKILVVLLKLGEGGGVTKEGAAKLKKALPNCVFQYDHSTPPR